MSAQPGDRQRRDLLAALTDEGVTQEGRQRNGEKVEHEAEGDLVDLQLDVAERDDRGDDRPDHDRRAEPGQRMTGPERDDESDHGRQAHAPLEGEVDHTGLLADGLAHRGEDQRGGGRHDGVEGRAPIHQGTPTRLRLPAASLGRDGAPEQDEEHQDTLEHATER